MSLLIAPRAVAAVEDAENATEEAAAATMGDEANETDRDEGRGDDLEGVAAAAAAAAAAAVPASVPA